MAEKASGLDARRDQIFPVLDAHDFARLKRFGTVRRFPSGTAIMRAGEVAPGLAFVLKGTIDVRQGGRRGLNPVMVQHHHIHAQIFCFFQRGNRGSAAIHRDYKSGAFGMQHPHRRR